MLTPYWIVLAVLGIAAALFLLDRLLLRMERRGWIYYRLHKHRSPGAMGNAFLEMQTMLDPGKRYIVEQRKAVRQEEREAGDRPPELPRIPHD